MEVKDFENIILLLKNSKINLLLVNNNLSYFHNIKDFQDDGILYIMDKINNIESEIENGINWTNEVCYEYNNVKKENDLLLNILVSKAESQNSNLDVIQSTAKENVDVEKVKLTDSNKDFVFETKNNNNKLDQNVGIILGAIALATVATVAVKTVSKIVSPSYSGGSGTSGRSGTSSGSGTSGGSRTSGGSGTSGGNGSSQTNSFINQLLGGITTIVNSFSSKVNNYINSNKGLMSFALEKLVNSVARFEPYTVTDELVDFIKTKEGFRSDAYILSGESNWTIGYGHSSSNVFQGQRVTEEEAEKLLRKDLKKASDAVYEYFKDYYIDGKKIVLTQHQFDALTSFTYNGGLGMLKQLTAEKTRSLDEIYNHMGLYTHGSDGQELLGLVIRRRRRKSHVCRTRPNNNRF